jgi:hypothetical protein
LIHGIVDAPLASMVIDSSYEVQPLDASDPGHAALLCYLGDSDEAVKLAFIQAQFARYAEIATLLADEEYGPASRSGGGLIAPMTDETTITAALAA